MKNTKEVLIIIPAYNEEKNIGKVLEALKQPEIASVADVLVMNDYSKDNTEAVVRKYGVKIVNHIFNLGYGNGLQLGYKYAVKKGYKYIIQMDADGQHDVSNILQIYEKLKTPDEHGKCPDIVLGSRFMKECEEYPTSLLKKIAYCLFRMLIKLGTGQTITDPTTGLQGQSRSAFSYYAKYNHFDDRYPDANMIMQMILLKYRVVEIPAVMHLRTEGVSMHSGLRPIIYMFRMMFSIVAVWVRIKLFHVEMEGSNAL
ncbi:MAG: glycosyltransferase family 2 protein [Eubacteriales bacterium]|nr:glycosyltransferase family 2 protein [Eubacteriales bacterium]